jgi:3-hydroxymyristoyl/3-hydroxydecanoyl-(acyl carrier protein) dehydratase
MGALDPVWRVPADHPAFAGHFPGHPILPGVVLLDRAVLLAQQRLGADSAAWRVSQAKFLSPCGPGDELAFELQEGARGGWTFVVRCGERDVASGQLQAASL